MPKVHGFFAKTRNPAEMYASAKTKTRVWLKLSWIHQKMVQFCHIPLKYVTICCINFALLTANRKPYFGRYRDFGLSLIAVLLMAKRLLKPYRMLSYVDDGKIESLHFSLSKSGNPQLLLALKSPKKASFYRFAFCQKSS